MLRLSEKWIPALLSQPETGMSYQIATIVLHDGRLFERVVIVGGIISEIDGKKEIPFQEDEIREIIVTHAKKA